MPIRKNIPEVNRVRERFIQSFEELRYRKLIKTKTEFCENVGLCNSSNMSRMEREQKEPTISNVLLLVKKYGVSIDWIMFGKGEFMNK